MGLGLRSRGTVPCKTPPTHTTNLGLTRFLIVTGGETSDELALPNYITVVAPTSPVTTQTTAPVSATGTTRAPATQASISSETTTAVPSGQNDRGGIFGYVIAIVVIAIIAGIAVMIYRRHNR